jgi:hypothetical protein
MRSISKLSTLSCFICALCSLSAGAMARDIIFAGGFCQPAVPNKQPRYNQFGPYNPGSSGLTVECLFHLDFSLALRMIDVFVLVYDRNPSANVSCTVRGITLDGSTIWARTLSSSGSGVNRQSLQLSPVYMATAGFLHMTCNIPSATDAGVSHVTTYFARIDT